MSARRVACGFLLAAGLFMAVPPADAFLLRGSVVANGAQRSAGGGHQLLGTVGQGIVGGSQGAGFFACHGFWCFGGSRVVSVEWGPDGEPGDALPRALAFGPPVPNPARGLVRFQLELPEPATVTLSVYDVAGRELGEPMTRPFDAGRHELRWSAPAGHAGVYFGRIEVEGRVRATRRIVLVP